MNGTRGTLTRLKDVYIGGYILKGPDLHQVWVVKLLPISQLPVKISTNFSAFSTFFRSQIKKKNRFSAESQNFDNSQLSVYPPPPPAHPPPPSTPPAHLPPTQRFSQPMSKGACYLLVKLLIYGGVQTIIIFWSTYLLVLNLKRPPVSLGTLHCIGKKKNYANVQALVVQRLDNAIHRLNNYRVDSVVCFANTYPLGSDLSGG